MKRNRGSVRMLLLTSLFVAAGALGADVPYRWEMTQSKTRAVQHEAVLLEYVCRFAGEGYEYVIAFQPPMETPKYRMKLLGETEQIINGDRVSRYRFVLFPKTAGTLSLAFETRMEKTTRTAIEQTVIGRDNVERFDYDTRIVKLPEAKLVVTRTGERFAGTFDLSVDVTDKSVRAYEPVQMKVMLEGVGNLDDFKGFDLNISGVRIFSDGIEKNMLLTDSGYRGSISQHFAFVSDRDFAIPAVRFAYFDTDSMQEKVLKHAAVSVGVAPLPKAETLLDAPREQEQSDGRSWGWINIVLALLAGIAIGRFLLPVSQEDAKNAPLSKRLRACRDPKRFAALLAIEDAQKHSELIDFIEQRLRRGEKIDLKAIKKKLS